MLTLRTDALIWRDERHGPLPAMLLALTMVTGIVDAVSYLRLGHTFVANMTGNVVLLGFALAGAADLSAGASLVAIVMFLVGAVAGGRLGVRAGKHRPRLLAIALGIEIALVGAALVVSMTTVAAEQGIARYLLIVPLALSMGLQNATARHLGVPDLPTTVLTTTLTGFAADSPLAGGKQPDPIRRLIAAMVMLIGAAIGAALILHVGIGAALGLAAAILTLNGIAAYRASSSSEPWTVGT